MNAPCIPGGMAGTIAVTDEDKSAPIWPRTFASITPVVIPGTGENPYPTTDVYAVATDGSAWVRREFVGAWEQLPDLPGVSLLSATAQVLLASLRAMVDFHAGEDDANLPALATARALLARLDGAA